MIATARTTVNRVLLCLVGLVLLVLGGVVLVAGLDLPGHWGFALPSWWPYRGPDDVLLSAQDRTRYRAEAWWWPMVIGALAVLALIALGWLLAHLGRRRIGRVVVDSGPGGRVLLSGRALEDALAADAGALPGVSRADVTVTGHRGTPVARLRLLLTPPAEPSAVVAGLAGQTLQRARSAASLEALPVEVRLFAERPRAQRVE